jgi:hypothetical protein
MSSHNNAAGAPTRLDIVKYVAVCLICLSHGPVAITLQLIVDVRRSSIQASGAFNATAANLARKRFNVPLQLRRRGSFLIGQWA